MVMGIRVPYSITLQLLIYDCIGVFLSLDNVFLYWYGLIVMCKQIGPLGFHGDTTSAILVMYQLIWMVCVLLTYLIEIIVPQMNR